MPNRLLKDWTNSEKVNSISVYAERFFTRLIMKADDYGCFFADQRILKANLFPYLLDSIREADLTRWMAECQKAGLIVLYESSNKKYLQILDFGQRLRQKTNKFPLPTNDQLLSAGSQQGVSIVPHEVEEEVEGKLKMNGAADKSATYTTDQENNFKNFNTYLGQHAPNVLKMKEPITIEQFFILKKTFSPDAMAALFVKMHNWKELNKKNISAYLTFLNWSKKDYNDVPVQPAHNGAKLSQAVNAIENGPNESE